MDIRKSVVAGKFYEDSAEKLIVQIENCFTDSLLGPGTKSFSNHKIKGAIVPHAGYFFSGPVAAHAYRYLSPENYQNPVFYIISPNHTGKGGPISLSSSDYWQTPLGNVPVNKEIVEELSKLKRFEINNQAHLFEHSVEVHLPFLQYIFSSSKFSIVPITISLMDINFIIDFSDAIGDFLNLPESVFLISSDFSHYVSKKYAYEKDLKAIEHILKNERIAFSKFVLKNSMSICGTDPILSIIKYSSEKNLKPELLKYATSGDVIEMEHVVGYASIIYQ